MSKLNFARELENSIASVFYSVENVAYFIYKAQDLYDDDNDSAAREALEDAVALLRAAGEDWAANKVQYYTRFC